jgi:TonB family protein
MKTFFKSTVLAFATLVMLQSYQTQAQGNKPVAWRKQNVSNNSVLVYKGLTLYRIMQNTGHSVEQLRAWNNLSSNLIYPGQTIYFYNKVEGEPTTKVVKTKPITKPVKPAPIADEDEIFTIVEQQAEYKGGQDEMYRYLSKNIKYPENASREHISGKVFTSFVVSKTGEIKDVKVEKGIGYGCDEEAVRVIRNMPNWQPALQDGKPVNSKFTLPIVFSLQE